MISGTFYANGAGLITEWKDTAVFVPRDPESALVFQRDFVADAARAGSQISYEVSPDCRFVIRALIDPPGDIPPIDLEVAGTLASGGREGFAIQTAPSILLSAEFKSLDPPLDEDIEFLKTLAKRMASALGVLRRGDVDK